MMLLKVRTAINTYANCTRNPVVYSYDAFVVAAALLAGGLYPTRQTPASYEFRYGIKDDLSDNDYGHLENREGDFTQGSYHVQLPDGRLQKVTYSVKGDSGFVVQVTYEGEAGPPAAV
nr:pro-resilin-like [Procambarus clarkii]